MTKYRTIIFIICFSTFLQISPAYAKWYQVEVIVFENLTPSLDGEVWYDNPGLPDRSESIELISILADDEELQQMNTRIPEDENHLLKQKEELIPYLQLQENEHKLDGVFRILKLSRQYRPYLHVSWQQPGLANRRARAVHLQSTVKPDDLSAEELLDQEPDDIQALQNNVLENEIYQVLDLIFDGTIRLRSSRFLHVDIDMVFFPELLAEENIAQEAHQETVPEQHADYVRLKESRKIKLNEIHYFDHPLFGLLLRVSRLRKQ